MNTDLKQWQYYLALESDFIKTIRFVELDSDVTNDNYKAYSIEYSKMLLLIGPEFESVANSLIKHKEPTLKIGDISDIKYGLLKHFPKICKNQIRIPKYKITFLPFKDWDNGGVLSWWSDYNSLKHNRLKSFKEANLKNVLNSMGCLLIVLVYLYRYRDEERELLGNNLTLS